MMQVFSLIMACNAVAALILVVRNGQMHGELLELRREVEKCLRILYAAVEEDSEGGEQDA